MKFPTTGKNLPYPTGNVIQGFGENSTLYSAQSNGRLKGHPGIDIVPNIGYGQPVFAPTDGVIVSLLYHNTGYGHEVEMISDQKWDGWQLDCLMGHLTDTQIVHIGDKVKEGQIIGYMGNSGFVVSGGVQYWGESNPDHRGTHTHWRTQWLKEVPAGQASNTSFLGKNYLIKNYGNGFDSSFDPQILFQGDHMNTVKIVKSKKSPSIYWCYEMPDMDYLTKKANIEGAVIPDPLPDTDTL